MKTANLYNERTVHMKFPTILRFSLYQYKKIENKYIFIE